jgi:hypothetical protein
MARATIAAILTWALAATAQGVTEIHDVVYRTVDGVALTLDIYLPGGAVGSVDRIGLGPLHRALAQPDRGLELPGGRDARGRSLAAWARPAPGTHSWPGRSSGGARPSR